MIAVASIVGLLSLAMILASLFVGQYKELTQFRAHMTMAFLAQKNDAGTIKIVTQGFEPLDHPMSERELAEKSSQLIGHLVDLRFPNLHDCIKKAQDRQSLHNAETMEMPAVNKVVVNTVNFVMLPSLPVVEIELSENDIDVMYLTPESIEIGFTKNAKKIADYRSQEIRPDTLLDMGVRLNVGGIVRRKL